jgi:diguanylate cyclase (GGDEF)-like protein/PAS domain S-box-containing protein
MKLLIVDDQPTNRKLLRAQLEAEGHGVVEAGHGIEALEVLERDSVDGVISDILMPNMDGFRLCLEIRKRRKHSRMPFVFYTSTYKSPQDRQLALTVGADHYLTKPCATRVILGALEEAMQKTRDRIAVSAAQHTEVEVLKQYNEALVRKLEERNTELEEALKEQRIAHQKVRESEERFRQLAENIDEVFFLTDTDDARVHYVSPAYEQVWGRTRESLVSNPKSWADSIHPDDHERVFAANAAAEATGKFDYTYRIVRPDGSIRWVHARGFPVLDENGKPYRTAGVAEDITERKRQEERIEKLARIRSVSSAVNSTIVRVQNRRQLLEEACRIAVEHGRFQLAWTGAFDRTTLEIAPEAWAGIGAAEYVGAFKVPLREDIPEGRGVIARAVRTREPVFDNDIEARPGVGGRRRKEAIRRGYRSIIALPLLVENEVTGTLTMIAKGPNFFNSEEVNLLSELAGNISFALEHIARRERIEKLSRIRAFSGEINAAIVRVRDRETLLQDTCRIAVEQGRFELVWIGAVDSDRQEVRPVASAGFSREATHAVSWATIAAAQGTLGEAIATRRAAVRNDLESEMPEGKLRQEALQAGCLSTVCLPLIVHDRVVTLIVLFAAGRGYFDEDELVLLHELAADLSFALQSMAQQEEVEYLSYYDTLTGLPNRTLFIDRAGPQLRARGGEPLMVALILLNLERFRLINETLGRQGGDELLKLVARRLENAFHGKDYLARVGGNSFGVLMRGIRDTTAVIHAVDDQILGCFHEPFKLDGSEIRAAAKVGIALFPADGADADALFRNAEAALKKARESGERYLFYAAEMNARAAQILSLETRLRKAVETRQFVLHYQLKRNLATGEISGIEALVRWNDPQSGLVAPGTFIPLLEETGLILDVGKWVLSQALSDHRAWLEHGLKAPRIAVNVSAIQLQQRDFNDMVINTVQEQGDNPNALELEVTESLLVKDVQDMIRKLSVLRGLGIEIAVDDFGTGYSSLRYLAKLPINSLKIDRSFITGMTGNPQDMAIVTTIIALAHSLNLKVTAEGVETEGQAKLLRLLKCDEGQGYLFSKPLPAESLVELLGKSTGGTPAP